MSKKLRIYNRYFLRSVDLLDSSESDFEDDKLNITLQNSSNLESSSDDEQDIHSKVSDIIDEIIEEISEKSSRLSDDRKNNSISQIKVFSSQVKSDLSVRDTSSINHKNMSDLNYKLALLSIPRFKGDSESLQQFIQCCELIVKELKDTEIPKFLGLMNSLLVDKASDVIKFNTFDSWDALKQELETRFSCPKSVSQLQSELLQIKQTSNESIQDYVNKIEIILSQLNGACIKAEGDVAGKILQKFNSNLALKSFENGIFNESVRIIVKSSNLESFRDAVKKAIEEEVLIPSLNTKSNVVPGNSKFINNKCQLCGIVGHTANICRKFQSIPNSQNPICSDQYMNQKTTNSFQNKTFKNSNNLVCAYCKRFGHHISNCFKRNAKSSNQSQPTPNVNSINSDSGNSQQLEVPTSTIPRVQNLP